MHKIALLVLFVLTIAACSKEQRTINRLDGTWLMLGRRVGGIADTTFSEMLISFERCRHGGGIIGTTDERCQGSIRQVRADNGAVEESDFSFTAEYGAYDLNIDFGAGNTIFPTMRCHIYELSKRTLTFEYTTLLNGHYETIKLDFRRIE